jgi:SAM-dependent methyltransferase
MADLPSESGAHPDQARWNAKYGDGSPLPFRAHPLAIQALSLRLPAGPVLDLACGPSGSVLAAAATGRAVTAVDISDVALARLRAEARRRDLLELITLVHADLEEWRPVSGGYALVLCTGYWDRALFGPAASAVAAGGIVGWEAFTMEARHARPSLPAAWCLDRGEPASLLPAGFTVLDQHDLPDPGRGAKRRLLARRRPGSGGGSCDDSSAVAAGQHRPDDEDIQGDDQDRP